MKPEERPQTIQATSKKWKAIQLLSGLTLVFVTAVLIVAILINQGQPMSTGYMLVLLGCAMLCCLSICGLIFGKFMAWWHHS